jgi:hypothetical protein
LAQAIVSGNPGVAGCRVMGGFGLQESGPGVGQEAVAAVIGTSTARKFTLPVGGGGGLGGEVAVAHIVMVPSSRTSVRSITCPTIDPEFAIPLDGFMKYAPPGPQLAFKGAALLGSQFGTAHGLTEPT